MQTPEKLRARADAMEVGQGASFGDTSMALRMAADEIERLREALGTLARAGEVGMAPDFSEWLTFHEKVAKIANKALSN